MLLKPLCISLRLALLTGLTPLSSCLSEDGVAEDLISRRSARRSKLEYATERATTEQTTLSLRSSAPATRCLGVDVTTLHELDAATAGDRQVIRSHVE